MAECCTPRGYEQLFGPRSARSAAKRYRRNGLDKTAERMVAFLGGRGVVGASVLERGGGVGQSQIEWLTRGAARTVNVELVRGYETEAQRLLQDSGLVGRTERRVQDIAVRTEGIEAADIVVLHRVVCCYPDFTRLLGSAADLARRLLVFSYPRHDALGRLVVRVQNAFFKLRRNDFRAFNHSPDAMLAVLGEHGLRRAYAYRGPVWQVAGLER